MIQYVFIIINLNLNKHYYYKLGKPKHQFHISANKKLHHLQSIVSMPFKLSLSSFQSKIDIATLLVRPKHLILFRCICHSFALSLTHAHILLGIPNSSILQLNIQNRSKLNNPSSDHHHHHHHHHH